MNKFIQNLSADEAVGVLNDLLSNDPGLLKKAYEAAVKVAADVDSDLIMQRVFSRLNMLDLDNLNGRAGRTRYGYVEPIEAAWKLFEEALDPFVDEMRKNQERGLSDAAKAYCIGIVKGLWQYDRESSSDFSEWVEDAPGEYVHTVIDEWKKGNPSSEAIAEVLSIARGDES
jgi:hypothetical protein